MLNLQYLLIFSCSQTAISSWIGVSNIYRLKGLVKLIIPFDRSDSCHHYATVEPTVSFEFPQHDSLPESSYTQVIDASSQIPIAKALREYYDDVYKDPRQAPSTTRPLVDPWLVYSREGKNGQLAPLPGDIDTDKVLSGERDAAGNQIQYSLKRALCQSFFTPSLYESLLLELQSLASSVGLTSISNPWLSVYTDGDVQNFHTDAPHGPLAFVLSLCKNDFDFQGGETILLQPKMLDYFRSFDASRGLEAPSIIRYIPPRPLGRCIAFDPRVPHGVNRVYGTYQDPRKARVVIHGWFMEPNICWFGPWSVTDSSKEMILDNALNPLIELLATTDIGRVIGYLAVRLDIEIDGAVSHVRATCDTIVADMDDFRGVIGYDEADRPIMEDAAADVRLNIFETLKNLHFEAGSLPGRYVIVPFSFE